jgi:hypothetical protein
MSMNLPLCPAGHLPFKKGEKLFLQTGGVSCEIKGVEPLLPMPCPGFLFNIF